MNCQVIQGIIIDRLSKVMEGCRFLQVAELRLDKILEKKGISKRQFSKMLEEDESNVYRYFRDGYDPKLSTLRKWASKLKMKVSELVKELLND